MDCIGRSQLARSLLIYVPMVESFSITSIPPCDPLNNGIISSLMFAMVALGRFCDPSNDFAGAQVGHC